MEPVYFLAVVFNLRNVLSVCFSLRILSTGEMFAKLGPRGAAGYPTLGKNFWAAFYMMFHPALPNNEIIRHVLAIL